MKPEYISDEAWYKARSFLSVNFTVPIGDRVHEVIGLAINIQALEAYDYKMVTWEEFGKSADVLPLLYDRAKGWYSDGAFDFVVYDPIDDENGYMIVGNDPKKVAKEVCEYIADKEPSSGPLSEDVIAMIAVETSQL